VVEETSHYLYRWLYRWLPWSSAHPIGTCRYNYGHVTQNGSSYTVGMGGDNYAILEFLDTAQIQITFMCVHHWCMEDVDFARHPVPSPDESTFFWAFEERGCTGHGHAETNLDEPRQVLWGVAGLSGYGFGDLADEESMVSQAVNTPTMGHRTALWSYNHCHTCYGRCPPYNKNRNP
jgi:hypothetical protein